MTITTYGGDGTVNEAQWSELMDMVSQSTPGAMVVRGNDYKPSVATGTRKINVAKGKAVTAGVLADSDAVESVELDANNGSNPRLDLVCLETTWAGAGATTKVIPVKGTNAKNPVRPSLTQTPGVKWQAPVGEVTVKPGVGQLADSALADIRPTQRSILYRPSIPDVSQPWQTPHWQQVVKVNIDDPGWPYRITTSGALMFQYTAGDNNGNGMAAIWWAGAARNVSRNEPGCYTPCVLTPYTSGIQRGPTSVALVMQSHGDPGKNSMHTYPYYSSFQVEVRPA